ncbi:hypothetical protein [Fodinicola acaciae]|uniref:hypothetical protein n=1 Tax=Fodinicola acaciae TaxID=2681555 RepID=UPI0013D19472|nr:hypothetical protein [Fodinicola acaciae]
MTSTIATWIGRTTATGAAMVTAAHMPLMAAIATGALLALITWLALTSTHAKTKTRRDAACATLTLILNFLRPPRPRP